MFLKLNDSEIKCLLLFGPALCQEKKTHTMYDYISKWQFKAVKLDVLSFLKYTL